MEKLSNIEKIWENIYQRLDIDYIIYIKEDILYYHIVINNEALFGYIL